MVRIAGIDKDFTPLELMFAQAAPDEKMEIAAGYLANTVQALGDIEVKVELESDAIIVISAKKVAK